MMKQDVDLSSNDDDVYSWLDAPFEMELPRFRKNLLRN